MRVAIVGAGMAGLSCGEALCGHGHDVALFDKGRRPGGRISTRTLATPLGDAAFDYGTPYLLARDPGFRLRVAGWREAGVVAPWPAAGEDAVVGMPGMSAPLADMAGRLPVAWSTRVASLRREGGRWRLAGEGGDIEAGSFDAVAVAAPAEQVAALIGDHDPRAAGIAGVTPTLPCWTLMAAFAEPLAGEAAVIGGGGDVVAAIRDSAKPGRGGPDAWVVHAAPAWSARHLEEDRAVVAPALLAAFGRLLGIALPEPIACAAHRWRFARSGRAGEACRWNGELRLGLCGDWLIGPHAEAAWLSGAALARAIAG